MRVSAALEQVPAPGDVSPDNDSDLTEVLESNGIANLADSPELRELISGAMNGTLELTEPLTLNQPDKLSQRAIQIIMLSVGNFYTKREIAAIAGMDYIYVTALLRHQWARRILTVANAAQFAQSVRIDRHLKRHSPKMLKIVREIAEDVEASKEIRLKAAFGWLDRSGTGTLPTQKVETTHTHVGGFTVTHERSTLIAAAIRESAGLIEAPRTNEIIVEAPSYTNPEVIEAEVLPAEVARAS